MLLEHEAGATSARARWTGADGALARHGVSAALVAGLLARVVMISVLFGWDAQPPPSDDATYVQYARGILETGRLSTHHFPVGYPAFLALVLGATGDSFVVVRILHVLLGLATVVSVSRIARRLSGWRSAVVAAWATALYPPLVYMTGRIMSETLFIALLAASLQAFVERDAEPEGRSPWRQALGAGLFALACLVRSNLLLMLPVIPLWLLVRRGQPWRPRLAMTVVATAAAGALLALPGFYFLATRGEYLPFATNSGQTFYGANNPLARGGWIQVEDHPELLAGIAPEERDWEQQYSRAHYRLGFQWIREHPADFARLLPLKLAYAWIPGLRETELTSRSRVASLVFILSYGLILVGAIAGRWLVRPAGRDGLLLAVLAAYTAGSLIAYGNARIGLFCAPVLIVYAASLASPRPWRRVARGEPDAGLRAGTPAA